MPVVMRLLRPARFSFADWVWCTRDTRASTSVTRHLSQHLLAWARRKGARGQNYDARTRAGCRVCASEVCEKPLTIELVRPYGFSVRRSSDKRGICNSQRLAQRLKALRDLPGPVVE